LIARNDLPSIPQISVQLIHAALQFGTLYGPGPGIPNVVLLKPVDDVDELRGVLAKVQAGQLPHYAYQEPDFGFGFTALIALARTPEQRAVFRGYPTWKLAGGAGMPAHHLDVDPGTNSPVVSNAKTPASKAGDASERLAGRTSSSHAT
jgi:hypothetical protein